MYNSIAQKCQSGLFEYYQENSLDSLLKRLAKLLSSGYCFRGQRNSLWEINSSAQRAWNNLRCKQYVVGSVDYKSYLSLSFNYANEKIKFPECDLSCRKNGLRDHERWGYLQHYSWPTPFIDFTNDFRVALFMATKAIPHNAIDGYFSIYAILPEFDAGEENIDLDEWVKSVGGAEEWYEFNKWYSKITFIMHKNSGCWCPEISKGRMASQGGLFVYLSSADISLEEVFAQRHKMDIGEGDDALEEHNRIVCIDIPYSLVAAVKAYLLDEKINSHILGLEDDSLDSVMKVQYGGFESDFIRRCEILNSKIKIGCNAFVRNWQDDVLFWDGRTEASRLISGGAALEGSVGRHFKRWEDIVWEIAEKFHCPFAIVEGDYTPIITDMAEDGLIEISEGTSDTVDNHAAVSCGDDAGKLVSGEWFDFFKRNRLPIELHIDLTAACTERCVHCYLPNYPDHFLEYDLINKVMMEFREMQGLTVYLTGGECMLHPEFEKICRRCRELDLNFIVMSNLTLCDKQKLVTLKETDPQYVNVSLYSMDAAEHDAITRRKGSWQETIYAILACEKAGIHIRLASPLLKENQYAFKGLQKFADEHHMHLVTDCCIFPRCNHDAANLDHVCSSEELKKVLEDNKEIFNQGWRDADLPSRDGKVCEIGDARICLNARGKYYPCDGMHEYVLGDAKENTLKEIWHGTKFDELRALKNKDFDKCASCGHRSFCKVCPAYNFNATGTLTETLPEQCDLAKVIHSVYGGE